MDEKRDTGDSQRHVSLSLEGGTNTWVGWNNVSYDFLSGHGHVRRDFAAFTATRRQHATRDQHELTEGLKRSSELTDDPLRCLTTCDITNRSQAEAQLPEEDLSAIETFDITKTEFEQRNECESKTDFQEHRIESVDQQTRTFDPHNQERKPPKQQQLSNDDMLLKPEPYSVFPHVTSKSTTQSPTCDNGVQRTIASPKDVTFKGVSAIGPFPKQDYDESEVKSRHGPQHDVVPTDTSSIPGNVHSQGAAAVPLDVDPSDSSDIQSDWEGWSDWEGEQGSDNTPDNAAGWREQNVIGPPDINIRNVMIGDNNLLIKIGDDVIRHHTVGNIEFELKIRKFQQSTETIEGRRRINISMQIEEFPTAENAALEALKEDNMCSRIRQVFSKMAATLLSFRRGSIVLEIKPESENTVHELFQSVEDGSFDDVVLDILKHDQVLNQIIKKKVKVVIDISVPKQDSPRQTTKVRKIAPHMRRGIMMKRLREEEAERKLIEVTSGIVPPHRLWERLDTELSELVREQMGSTQIRMAQQWHSILQNVYTLGLFTMGSLVFNALIVLFISICLGIITDELVAKVVGMTVCCFITGQIGSEMDGPGIKRGAVGGGLLGAVLGACLTVPPTGPFVMIFTWTGTILVSSALGNTVGGQGLESVLVGVIVGLAAFDVSRGLLKALMIGLSIFEGRFSDNTYATSAVRAVIAAAAVGSFIGPIGTAVLAVFALGTKMLGGKIVSLMVPMLLPVFISSQEIIAAFEQINTSLGAVTSAAVLGMMSYIAYKANEHDRTRDILAYGGGIGLVLGSVMFTVDGSALLVPQKDTIVAALIGGVLADFYIDRSDIQPSNSRRKTLIISLVAGSLIGCALGLVSCQLSLSVVNFVLNVTKVTASFVYIGA